jgi:hypothetical protein
VSVLVVGSMTIGAIQLFALWLQGRARTRALGYLLSVITVAVMNVPYNVITGQWGFMVSSIICSVLAYRAYRDVRAGDLTARQFARLPRPTSPVVRDVRTANVRDGAGQHAYGAAGRYDPIDQTTV